MHDRGSRLPGTMSRRRLLTRTAVLGGAFVGAQVSRGRTKAEEATPTGSARPWPPPGEPWVMSQVWNDLLFAHWPVTPDSLRPLIPPGLALDTFDGEAWVGIVPFWISDIEQRLMPGARVPSDFPEVNVRTYVAAEDRPGVWFFSLDAGHPLVVALARQLYHLPYYTARMSVTPAPDGAGIDYASVRTHEGAPAAELRCRYGPVGTTFTAEAGSLDHWLLERYCLYAVAADARLLRAEIDHAPWDLQRAEAEFTTNTMASAAGITLPDTPPLLHFARRREVVAWTPREVGSAAGSQ